MCLSRRGQSCTASAGVVSLSRKAQVLEGHSVSALWLAVQQSPNAWEHRAGWENSLTRRAECGGWPGASARPHSEESVRSPQWPPQSVFMYFWTVRVGLIKSQGGCAQAMGGSYQVHADLLLSAWLLLIFVNIMMKLFNFCSLQCKTWSLCYCFSWGWNKGKWVEVMTDV